MHPTDRGEGPQGMVSPLYPRPTVERSGGGGWGGVPVIPLGCMRVPWGGLEVPATWLGLHGGGPGVVVGVPVIPLGCMGLSLGRFGSLCYTPTETGGSLGGAFGGPRPALEGAWGHSNSTPLLGAPVRLPISPPPKKLRGVLFFPTVCGNLCSLSSHAGCWGAPFAPPNFVEPGGGGVAVTPFPPKLGCSGGFPISPEFWGVHGHCSASPPVLEPMGGVPFSLQF